MKIEIEITEQEIQDAVARKVRLAIADQANQWSCDEFIRATVKTKWQEIVSEMVETEMRKSEEIKQKIRKTIEGKIKSQLTALMKGN